MNTFEKMSNPELLRTTCELAAREREITLEMVERVRVINRRKAFIELGHESLRDYLVKELKYPAASAQRRVDAFKVLETFPVLADDIASGELNLSIVSRVQAFVRQQQLPRSERLSLFKSMRGKTTREVEHTLKTIAPEAPAPDRVRVVSKSHVELKIMISHAQLAKLVRVRSMVAHRVASYSDLFELLADVGLKELDPGKPVRERSAKPSNSATSPARKPVAKPASAATSTAEPKPPSRYIPKVVRRTVWQRDGGRCTYPGCESRHALQFDHVQPFAMGGLSDDPDNLRLLCRQHNLFRAVDSSAIPTTGLES